MAQCVTSASATYGQLLEEVKVLTKTEAILEKSNMLLKLDL
jgi:hypothetical protein